MFKLLKCLNSQIDAREVVPHMPKFSMKWAIFELFARQSQSKTGRKNHSCKVIFERMQGKIQSSH